MPDYSHIGDSGRRDIQNRTDYEGGSIPEYINALNRRIVILEMELEELKRHTKSKEMRLPAR